MQSKVLMNYMADKGSCVINGIAFSNGVGDGSYDVVVSNEKPANVEEVAWVDFRDKDEIGIWAYDCDPSSVYWYTSTDFYNAEAIGIGVGEDGDIHIWKMF